MLIVSFSLAVPYEGVPHAGGEYYLRHVEALAAQGHEVHVVAAGTPDNTAGGPAPAGVQVHLVPVGGRRALPLREWFAHRFTHIGPEPGFVDGVLRDVALVAALRRAQVVEFQWTQMATLLPRLRPLIAAGASTVCVAHDVMSQSNERRLAQAGLSGVRHTARRLRLDHARRVEPVILNRIDLVLTFSDKDRSLLIGLGVRTRIVVLRPPLARADLAWDSDPVEDTALFVGVFDRVENATAAQWLLEEVWPLVLRMRPGARLRIVGARPTDAMRDRAAVDPSVEVTGYVTDLGDEYRNAAVALVPLLLGSGVKFKTVTAIAWGRPVVSTTIGAEGVLEEDDDPGLAIADDPTSFASAVVEVLAHPAAAMERAAGLRSSVLEQYGPDAFAQSLAGLYGDLDSDVLT